mmetsp:Transcript_112/g.231  ORF Transcript_112/g.231 Transcript_112/m.231 type:complete len:231 (-) Transcript_112:580-1272(-)
MMPALSPSPLSSSTGPGTGGLGAEKYRLAVPTPGSGLDGEACRVAPSSRMASGPSTATTTPLDATTSPLPATTTRAGEPPEAATTLSTLAPVKMEPAGRPAASWSATAPMPAAGRQLEPVASMRITNSNRRELVPSLRSKKMPPKKGVKNFSMMESVKPSALRRSLMLVSGLCSSSCRLPARLRNRSHPTRILSTGVPTGLVSDRMPSTKWRRGSATLCHSPPVRTSAPA